MNVENIAKNSFQYKNQAFAIKTTLIILASKS